VKRLNLLDDAIIPLQISSEPISFHTLPGALQKLSEGDVSEIADVKEYQVSAIEFFFAQLGVLAIDLTEDGKGVSPGLEVWRNRLLHLASPECWDLFNPDSTIPAFLQPGMSADDFASVDESKTVWYPDDMGTLFKSKNHGVKFSSMSVPSSWNWIVSLIEIQTMTAYEGAGNYGHQRMNGGYSYRFKAGIYENLTASGRWLSDVNKVLSGLDDIYVKYPHFDRCGKRVPLAWAFEWDGIEPLHTKDMHPLFIDTNRRLRLIIAEGKLACVRKTSSSMRVFDLKLNGAYGDPWAPLSTKRAVEKESAENLGYRALFLPEISLETLCNIIFGQNGFEMSLTQIPSRDQRGKDCLFEIKFLGKSQGKTEGFHSILVPIPTKAVAGLGKRSAMESFGKSSGDLLQLARGAQRALKIGIDTLCVNGSGKSADKSLVAAGLQEKTSGSLKKAIQANFFEYLWNYHDTRDADAWVSFLKALCVKEFDFAVQSGVTRTQLSFKAEALGRNAFRSYWYAVFENKDKGATA
jgi:hypothetical protein